MSGNFGRIWLYYFTSGSLKRIINSIGHTQLLEDHFNLNRCVKMTFPITDFIFKWSNPPSPRSFAYIKHNGYFLVGIGLERNFFDKNLIHNKLFFEQNSKSGQIRPKKSNPAKCGQQIFDFINLCLII